MSLVRAVWGLVSCAVLAHVEGDGVGTFEYLPLEIHHLGAQGMAATVDLGDVKTAANAFGYPLAVHLDGDTVLGLQSRLERYVDIHPATIEPDHLFHLW